ncbi:VOC family protein [Calditrichota bacterium]
MESPLVHFELAVSSTEKSRSFYKELFGWEFDWNDEMKYGMLNFKEGPGGGMMQVEGEMKPMLSVYFQVSNVNEYLAKAESLGATITIPRTEIPNMGAFGMFMDSDGIVIGIYEEDN